MERAHITKARLEAFAAQLRQEERSPGTVEKYLRDVAAFAAWLGSAEASREAAAGWKETLVKQGQAPATINAKLAAVNRFFAFDGRPECRVQPLRLQRRLFREEARELSCEEYRRLLETARKLGRERLELLLETICATGIRVSEVRYITVEAARRGAAEIALKGKIRTILLPGKLRRKLLRYAGAKKIASGGIFLTRNGKDICRRQVWAEMKALADRAGVAPGKVFPHNLRHLFAVTFYRVCRDVARLADVLGHSSIETTRIYLRTSGREHIRTLERLNLLC